MSPSQRIAHIRDTLPAEGLFAEKIWRFTPEPIPLPARAFDQLAALGQRLYVFQKACNLLYRQSAQGKAPAWIAEWLDAGKPTDLIEFARQAPLKMRLPAVIRPDLILTEDGWALAEIDSIPGGLGLTAWLSETYGNLGYSVAGGPSGLRHAFHRLFPEGPILISEEAAAYRPEWEWLLGPDRVASVESFHQWNEPTYRFFEGFEWKQLAHLRTEIQPDHPMTPPLKPFLEEKLWLALFWMRPLREFWRKALGDRYFRDLQAIIPHGWVVEPTPLPPTAVLPGLDARSWEDVASFSRKERELILKISGFSERAWGSRGVVVGSDVSNESWVDSIRHALDSFPSSPWLMQRFHKGSVIKHPYWHEEKEELVTMSGRARVCPYYIVEDDRAALQGVLVTLCPEDKKLLHGMSDAILAPAVRSEV
jgi:hypothetical protein